MADTRQRVLTVSELNRLAREVLESSFPLFWVSGEISNLTRAASGHWYFSLKDNGAQVKCVMFRGRNSYIDWIPQNGDKVEARATVTLYEARGDFQLTIEFIQRAGLGSLFEAFERLKQTMQLAGLFDASRKKPLPDYPKQIGIITSADAAALRDVLTTLKRRMPSIPIVIYPTPVQGKGSAELIAKAIQSANDRKECDVLILCRGGGSLEDLWSFNEEIVAHAIAASAIPIVSGVGHETDMTIADFVADLRAPTPTAAAEIVSPDRAAMLHNLTIFQQKMQRQMQYLLSRQMQHVDYLAKRLISPTQALAHKQSHLQQLQQRLLNSMTMPLQADQQRLQQLAMRLKNAMDRYIAKQTQQLDQITLGIQHLNPNAVLDRGYALVQTGDGTVVSSRHALHTGLRIHLTLADGGAEATVNETYEEKPMHPQRSLL